ncbi:MAG: FAD-dependent oxidoreductase [Actinobacteria bacterium]|nr:FAD-dependent oxidoreductase [Actinomycetota bacterium]
MRGRHDLVVLGGGTGGLVSALVAAGTGARVALVEGERTGGDCLWTGCVPSKSLIAAAGLAHRMRHADRVGLEPVDPRVDFARVMEHVHGAIRTIAPEDSPRRLREAGVDVIEAPGRFLGAGRLEAGGRELRFRAAIVATGSEPRMPPIDGLAEARPLTSDSVWGLRELPGRLVILGGGPIGCELGQAFARLGSRVTIVQRAERLLVKEEPRASMLIAARLAAEGVDVRLSSGAEAVEGDTLVLADGERIGFDRLLVATGRTPRTVGFGLDSIGVRLDGSGAVEVDRTLRTSAAGIYAVGDVTGLLPFTHVAAHHARVATPNALFHTRAKIDTTLPWATFTDPEVGRVGLTEEEARRRWGSKAIVVQASYATLDRAITAGEADGFVKLVGDPRGRLKGATVAAVAAGEAIAELSAWMAEGAKIDDISRAVHPYPTFAEGAARAADTHLAARYSSPRVRALSRAALALLRALERPR